MNMYLHELKALRKSTIIWSLSLVAIVALFMSLFPSFSRDMAEVNKLLEGFPEPVRKALGIELESFGSLFGYYSYALTYLALCGAIQGMNIGTGILSKEIREKTADFLLTKPVTRTEIVRSKILAGLTSLGVTALVYVVAAYGIVSVVSEASFDKGTLILMSGSIFLIGIIFLAIGLILSVLIPKIKSVLTFSLGTVFPFFLIGMLASSGEDEVKRYFSPFKYFESGYIIEHGKYELSFLILGAMIVVTAVLATFLIYRRKDIHTV